MASLITASINLSKIDKSKIIEGNMTISQSKEERDSKADKSYLGNVKVIWTNGDNVSSAPRDESQNKTNTPVKDDLPF